MNIDEEVASVLRDAARWRAFREINVRENLGNLSPYETFEYNRLINSCDYDDIDYYIDTLMRNVPKN